MRRLLTGRWPALFLKLFEDSLQVPVTHLLSGLARELLDYLPPGLRPRLLVPEFRGSL